MTEVSFSCTCKHFKAILSCLVSLHMSLSFSFWLRIGNTEGMKLTLTPRNGQSAALVVVAIDLRFSIPLLNPLRSIYLRIMQHQYRPTHLNVLYLTASVACKTAGWNSLSTTFRSMLMFSLMRLPYISAGKGGRHRNSLLRQIMSCLSGLKFNTLVSL